MGVRFAFVAAIVSLPLFAAPSAQTDPRGGTKAQPYLTEYLSHEHARPVFSALGEGLPLPSAWQEWIVAADVGTRARVAQGDETSLVNWLLFGTSFTNEPRVTSRQLDERQITSMVAARLNDFERALDAATRRDSSRAVPERDDERFVFARRVLGDSTQVRPRLLSFLKRAIAETETHERLIREARALGDPSLQFAERSRIYRERGLSSDTSLRASFALEQALRRGLTPVAVRGSDPTIRRVAVIGPGLDFTDKQEGFDFYPPQTIQPFAIIDSLVRLDLGRLDQLSVTTLDLSTRVNDHLDRAVARARGGSPYVVHVPMAADVSWKPDFVRYWESFGDRIGGATRSPTVPRAAGPVKLRSVAVQPSVVARLTARDVNITAQQLVLAGSERFDLVIATNVFVYYDRLQQALAMIGVSNMLRPGGFLLSNNAVVEVPSTGLKSVGYTKTLYSDRDEDGDLIICYQKAIR